MRGIVFAVLIGVFSSHILAEEIADYCGLVKSQAGAKAHALAWPTLISSVGHPFLSNDVLVAAGASQSISSLIGGLFTMSAADHQCLWYGADKAIKNNVLYFDDRILLLQAKAQKPILSEALKLADEHVSIERKLFDTQNGTITDLTDAVKLRSEVQGSMVMLEQKESSIREIPGVEPGPNLVLQLEQSKNYEAKAASLNSLTDAFKAWDIQGKGGARYDIATGEVAPFWSIDLTYSFGQIPSTLDAAKVQRFSRQYFDSRYDSAKNIFRRFARSLPDVLASERRNQTSIADQLKETGALLDKVKSVDSLRARRAQRILKIQQLQQRAALAASDAKIEEIVAWVKANTEKSDEGV